MARVEVALGEYDMATWYQATIVQEGKASSAGASARCKVKLLLMPQAMG